MLYMGNVNRFIFWILIPLIMISYIGFRVIEWRHLDDGGRLEIAKQHSINLNTLNDINCLILGGSNSVFSLSAEQMSSNDNLNCYNVSLLNEGHSDFAYFEFIDRLPIDKTQITNIFYSSLWFLKPNSFPDRLRSNEKKIGISGDDSFKLLGRSLASYLLKNLLKGKPLFNAAYHYPLPSSRGDFNFEEYDQCYEAKSSKINIDPALTSSIDNVFKDLVDARLLTIRGFFQNAQIYYVLPSTFRETASDDEKNIYYNYLQETFLKYSITFVDQSPFLNREVLCDASHHTNELGRKLRTSELLTLINVQNDQ